MEYVYFLNCDCVLSSIELFDLFHAFRISTTCIQYRSYLFAIKHNRKKHFEQQMIFNFPSYANRYYQLKSLTLNEYDDLNYISTSIKKLYLDDSLENDSGEKTDHYMHLLNLTHVTNIHTKDTISIDILNNLTFLKKLTLSGKNSYSDHVDKSLPNLVNLESFVSSYKRLSFCVSIFNTLTKLTRLATNFYISIDSGNIVFDTLNQLKILKMFDIAIYRSVLIILPTTLEKFSMKMDRPISQIKHNIYELPKLTKLILQISTHDMTNIRKLTGLKILKIRLIKNILKKSDFSRQYIRNDMIKSELPSDIFTLTQIESLSLSCVKHEGHTKNFKLFTQLTSLTLNYVKIDNFHLFVNIKILRLKYCALDCVFSLYNMNQLEELHLILYQFNLSNMFPRNVDFLTCLNIKCLYGKRNSKIDLKKLIYLKRLTAKHHDKIKHLSTLTNLNYLKIKSDEPSSVNLINMINLTKLKASNYLCESIERLVKLKILKLHQCINNTFEWTTLINLEKITLKNRNELNLLFLTRLSRLFKLDINTGVDDVSIFEKLTSLKYFIVNNKCTEILNLSSHTMSRVRRLYKNDDDVEE